MDVSFSKGAVVVTSISAPNGVLRQLAEGAGRAQARFLVIGDTKSPTDFALDGCEFFGIEAQREMGFRLARLCHERSYTRKNLGYLSAIAGGAEFIVETDDDNAPYAEFWGSRNPWMGGDVIDGQGWVNPYTYFSDRPIYPRGLPLEKVAAASERWPSLPSAAPLLCPIQQGLADGNPDVDAVYRMLFTLPLDFIDRDPLILRSGQWSPYNSQNTTTFRIAYPLLYLPTYCSFRMTDIWRSFVAQRVAWECGWNIAFHKATVVQDRNEHDLLRDFSDEVPGYLNNSAIMTSLSELKLAPGLDKITENMRACYRKLFEMGVVSDKEEILLDAWFADLAELAV